MQDDPIQITPVPAFRDNYLWLLERGGHAAVVDPGDAEAVTQALSARRLRLTTILVTHHHGDHAGGVAALAAAWDAAVYTPAMESIPTGRAVPHPLREGDVIEVLGTPLHVLDVPGHTAGHIAYHAPDLAALFCGDTLFAGGCGRLFEGTPAQMLASLRKLAALPAGRRADASADTRVYCAHEYTLANLRFARAVEPANAALIEREARCLAQRARGEPTVPSRLSEELATNPFLRVDVDAVRAAAQRQQSALEPAVTQAACDSDTQVFATLRAWKNGFA